MTSRASFCTSSRRAPPLCNIATGQGEVIRPALPIPSIRKYPHEPFYDHGHLSKRVKLTDGENEKWGHCAYDDIKSQPSIFSTTSPASTATPSQSGAGLSPIGETNTAQSNTYLTNGLNTSNDDKTRRKIERGKSAPVVANSKLNPPDSDKRTLRSQDGGSRSKSELALYFPNYEELISTEPKEAGQLSLRFIISGANFSAEYLTPSTAIYIFDDHNLSSYPQTPLFPTTPKSTPSKSTTPNLTVTGRTTFETLDFPALLSIQLPTAPDPLSPSHYFSSHRRAERQEKQLRNIEKERAQHEKVQLDRLLNGLKGHDWLRVMGISGITDTEKKAFESKRDYFIREVETLLEKFRRWKEEEKRRKVEKEISETADSDVEDGDEDEDSSDVDMLAARQLHREAQSHSRRRVRLHLLPPALPGPPPEEKPLTSFYSKPYLREAALGKHRRGRTRFAFGKVLPEIPEVDFELPHDFVTEDRIRASRRRGRAARRDKAEP